MAQSYLVVLLTLSLTSALLYQVSAFTDPSDVTVLKDLYRELNYPQQLVGWNSSGRDPCEDSWKGISCNGSSVIFIEINGLELCGRLGDQLFNLVHLKQLDLSFNDFSGNIPYSLTSMKYLRHLNLSHNSLSGPVGNVLTSLQNLKRMDLSNNNFTGDLPTSFQDLKNLTALFLQNNQFTGSVIFLANLPLTGLDIQNNHFSGVVPQQFQYIRNLWDLSFNDSNGNIRYPLSGPVGNVFTSLQNPKRMYDGHGCSHREDAVDKPGETWVSIASTDVIAWADLKDDTTSELKDRTEQRELPPIASNSTASHVDPLILVLCFVLCLLVLHQQQQPQPLEQQQPAQHDLDQDAYHEDEDEDAHSYEDEDDEQFHPNEDEDQLFVKDDRAIWKRERASRHHWKKRYNWGH